MSSDPHQLVQAARGGDKAAAAELIETSYQRIYAFLRRLAANDTDAADLTQRTFARVWQALPSFEGRASVSSWIHSIAYHAFVDWKRQDHRAEPRPDEWWAACATTAVSPDEAASCNDLAEVLYASVDRLETDLRHTVHLHYYQELTLQETADALGVATSTVKYRLRQAVAELQKTLAVEPPPQTTSPVSRPL
jgi:RNA polymerase sigma-70 factor (ECF subfamily)